MIAKPQISLLFQEQNEERRILLKRYNQNAIIVEFNDITTSWNNITNKEFPKAKD